MFHKILVKDLRVGMYTVDTGVSWLKFHGLFAIEGKILTEDELNLIKRGGFAEAYIDLTRSDPESLPKALRALLEIDTSVYESGHVLAPPKVPLQSEIGVAKAIYSSSLLRVKDLMDSMRQGTPTLSLSEPVVDDILDSLDRNSDALLGLCKLRQKDEYTYSHSANVSVLAVMLGRKLGLSRRQLELVGLGGLFHDLGKALIPEEIINAPRKLTEKEFTIMRTHPRLGYEQLGNIPDIPEDLLKIAIEHHERYDGLGYPHGLKGSQISLVATVVGISDVFDALSSRRVYKEAMPLGKTLSILYSMRNKEFPAIAIEHFIRLLGIFPIGSAVQLTDGRKGLVSSSNQADALRPCVIIVKDAMGRKVSQEEVNLSFQKMTTIDRLIPVEILGVDPADLLGVGNLAH